MFDSKRLFLSCFCLLLSCYLYDVIAQKNPKDLPSGIIHFLSGDTIVFKEVEKTDYYVSGFKQNKVTKKWVIKSYPAEDILFLEKESEKFYYYKYKPSQGGFLTRDEMEQYVKGKKNALYEYFPKNKIIKSSLFGLFIGLFDTSFDFYTRKNGWQVNDSFKGVLSSEPTFLSISTPLISTFLVEKNRLNLTDRSIMDEASLMEESYNHGYQSVKSAKDAKAVARGSLFGVGLIVVLSFFIN